MKKSYDVIIIGGGHAGIEASAAAARIGCRVLLITHSLEKIGELSCNPAIGGIGKGQLVKEVDALGGLMGRIADAACIQFRRLNTNRGAAVQSSRMQVDMDVYRLAAQQELHRISGLEILAKEVVRINVEKGKTTGVVLSDDTVMAARTVVITPGTFFHGLMHIGTQKEPGGRLGDPASTLLPENLTQYGIRMGRFKTGTTPRLDGKTIDFSKLVEQPGDTLYVPFSMTGSEAPQLKQVSCHIGHTHEKTHEIIRDNLEQSALYSGQITGTGVRYCPSVEDKIVRFPDRESHHVFVEPEGLSTDRYYPNGISNSLPLEIQKEMVHSIAGLEHAGIVQTGYGIEHDYVDPTQLSATLECKTIGGLFFAGQINGTTGYEEAAAQGLMAGINAAHLVKGKPLFVIDRSQGYIGVLIDDLVTKGTNEPYRMFTSRVEYRLVIREDNADERLTPLGHKLGLIPDEVFQNYLERVRKINAERSRLAMTRIVADEQSDALLSSCGTAPFTRTITLLELLRRPEIRYAELAQLDEVSAQIPRRIRESVEVSVKYEGYINRQSKEIEKFKYLENIRIPKNFIYKNLPGISLEVAEKLTKMQPGNLGQAGRISGITPGAISQLIYHIGKQRTSGV